MTATCLTFALGWLLWTFLEYALHGWLGHWPRGRRRHPLVVDGRRLRGALMRARTAGIRPTARELGVSARALGRWISGEHRPPPEIQRELVGDKRTRK